MANQVKVPKEIQELFFEAIAFNRLADASAKWILPSPKAFYYALRAVKVGSLAWRTLKQTFPNIDMAHWTYDATSGVAKAPVIEKPKAPRVPRKAKVKAEPATPAV